MWLQFPRGDRKPVVVDLSKAQWPTGNYRMRIYTGTSPEGTAMWFIDRVRLTEEPPAKVLTTDVPLAAATLGFSGAPSRLDPLNRPTHPAVVKDDGLGALSTSSLTYGNFTR